MSIKSVLQTLINTKLASGTDITATELREVEDALLLNSYGTIINEKDTTVTKVITSASLIPGIEYDVDFVKQGRFVFMTGFIRNDTNFLEFNDFLEIVSSEYLPAPNPGNQYNSNNIENTILLDPSDNKLYGTVPASTTVYFSLMYNTLN